MPFYGDHPQADTEWLDEQATIVACPRCGAPAYARTRANSGGGLPLHRHVVVACVPCGIWQSTCFASDPIPQADVPVNR